MVGKHGGEVWWGSMVWKYDEEEWWEEEKNKKCVSVILSTLVDSFSVSSIRDNKRKKRKKKKVCVLFFFPFFICLYLTFFAEQLGAAKAFQLVLKVQDRLLDVNRRSAYHGSSSGPTD